MRTATTVVLVLGLLLLAAYIGDIFGPARDRHVAATPAACHAAAVEAAAKPNPTNVPCDWRAVEIASPDMALNGRYAAASPGVSGRLVIIEDGDKPARLAFSTAGESPRYICTAALEARRETDRIVARATDVPGCELTVQRTLDTGLVTVIASEPCNTFCNMRGSLSGEFKLMPH
jgi:hypothetical protein